MKIAYQGVPGAFSEAAAAALFPDDETLPQRTFGDVFATLYDGADAAVVPLENSHAGSVVDVYDLLHKHKIPVLAEAIVRVRHCLLGVPGATLDDIRVARSHPQALSQTDAFLRSRKIEPQVAFDTAGAADEVAVAGDRSVAAVASRRAARRYGLTVLAEDIETTRENSTRFVALAHDRALIERIPADMRDGPRKTSLAYATANIPGALTRSLQPFATAGLQLTKIESRPSREAAWDYVFYLDFEGDPARTPAREAIALMRTCCAWLHVLGTYPAATTVLDPE